jgi:threonine dehydrogenase-like Zn-dependent dehydrogenase
MPRLTGGRGADACIDAVGIEPETMSGFDAVIDRVKVATFMGTDRPYVLRQAIHCCRNFGTVSIVGVYGGFVDKIPIGSAINRGLTFRMAQAPVQHYLPIILERIEKGDRSFVRRHAQRQAGRRAGALQDVSSQAGRMHQSRDEALT